MTGAFRAEWTKLRSVRSTAWLPVAVVALTLLLTAVVSTTNETGGCAGDCEDLVQLILSGSWFGMFVVVAFGALVVTSEYSAGTIRATFAAVPRRRSVLAAKAAVLAAVVLAAGLVTSVAAFLLGRELLAGSGFTPENGYPTPSLADGPTLRAVAGTALYLTALALLSLGLGAIVRHTVGAVTAVLALLLGPLVLVSFLPADAADRVQQVSPAAGLAVQQTQPNGEFPIGPWAGLGVLAAWAAGSLVVALWLVGRREA